jgi:hypothetical protein
MGLGSLSLTVPGRRSCHQRAQQGGGNPGYFVDSPIECFLVCGRWFDKSSDLPYELQGRHPDFVARRRRFKIIKGLNVPAHFFHLASLDSFRCPGRMTSRTSHEGSGVQPLKNSEEEKDYLSVEILFMTAKNFR